MSTLLTPLKNEIAMQKDIFRLAAAIYSESSNVVSDAEIQLQMIKALFATSENAYRTKSEIISGLLDTYKYHISEDELEVLVRQWHGVFLSVHEDDELAYCLSPNALAEFNKAQEQSIDSFIDLYISENRIVDSQKCKNAIHEYLYELTTTNITSYRILLKGKDGTQFTSDQLSADVAELTDDEKKFVQDFLIWENPEKNVALGNLIYCCLEYCLLIHGDAPNKFLTGMIRNREIYLDTNIVFRALGINGKSRKKVMLAFLDKCKQAKLKLIVSHTTNQEFFDTIDYYVSTIERFPHGKIISNAYEQITDYNIFAFYEEWRQSHSNLSLKYFKTQVRALYLTLIKQYGIVDDEKMPYQLYNSEEFKSTRNKYSASIRRIKQGVKDNYLADDEVYSQRDSHDATLVRYIEVLREKSNDERDIFFVSSDKVLRLWDMNRIETKYPVVIYPSQLFLILLKTCGRSQNDYDSFVSFINIHPHSKQITPENAYVILSGISSITEDIKTQEYLVAAVYGGEFQDIIQNSFSDTELYEKVQQLTQDYLGKELSKSEENNKQLSETVAQQETTIDELKHELSRSENQLKTTQSTLIETTSKAKQFDEQQLKLAKYAESKTKLNYRWKVYGFPILLIVLSIAFISFVALQFFASTEKWNFVMKIFNWMSTTPFGEKTDSLMYTIDGLLGGALFVLYKAFWHNPFNKKKNKQLKDDLIKKYLSDNEIG